MDLSDNSNETKVVIATYTSFNKGTEALLVTRIAALRRFISNVSFTVFMFRFDPEVKKEFPGVSFYEAIGRVAYSKEGLRAGLRTVPPIIKCTLWRFFHRLHIDMKSLMKDERLNAYYNADVVLTIGGDTLTEYLGNSSFLSYFLNLFFGLLLDKPVVIYAESIGPFTHWWTRLIARFLLKRAKLITIRENISKQVLLDLGVDGSVHVTADSAFLLQPAPSDRVNAILNAEGMKEREKPLIGIIPSFIVPSYGLAHFTSPRESYDHYIALMARVASRLVDTLNATVLLIPHEIFPHQVSAVDDRSAGTDIRLLAQRNDRIICIEGNYTAEETKGIIGKCDLLIAGRLHAAIAATSLAIPMVMIAYHLKGDAIIGEMVGCSHYMLDINELSYEHLLAKIDDAWANKAMIRRRLPARIDAIQHKALLNAKLVKQMIE